MNIVTNNDLDLFMPTDQFMYEYNKLSETATRIARYNFQWRYITFVFYNATVLYGTERLLQTYGHSQIIGNGSFFPSFAQHTKQIIIFGTDIRNIMYALDWMRQHQFDNTGKYIVVCVSEKHQQCNETEAINVLWNHKVTNVVFLKNGYKEGEVVGYTYFPLGNDCTEVTPFKLIDLDACIKNEMNCGDMFPIKLKNLHKCPMIVSIYVQVPYMSVNNGKTRGVDGDLLPIIFEGMNATLRVMKPRRGNGWGNLEADGTWSGSLADVNDDVANFSMTSAAITLARFSQFQMSLGYYTTKVVWISRPRLLKPSSLKLLYPMKTSTQVALIISFVLVFLCAALLKSKIWAKVSKTLQLNPPRTSIVFHSWMICMGLPLTKLPTHQSLLSIVILWFWYCFMIRTIYQVCLITVLHSNYYCTEFETIEEVHEAQYSFGGGKALKDYYIDNPLVYNNWKELNATAIIPTLFEVAAGKQFVLAMNFQCAIALIRTHKLQVHILSQTVVTSPTVIFFKKFHPLVDPINRLLRRLIEFGLVDKTYKDNVVTKDVSKSKNTHGPININHYKGCYIVLVFGWIVSAIFFLCEICHNTYWTENKKL